MNALIVAVISAFLGVVMLAFGAVDEKRPNDEASFWRNMIARPFCAGEGYSWGNPC